MSLHSLRIDHSRSSAYLYQQVYEQLKQAILQHSYRAHERLPSKRELAESLKISLNSVNAAYQQLVAEGYVYTKERQGFFVEEIDLFQVKPSDALPELAAHLKESSAPKDLKIRSFSHMSADIQAFPMDKWLTCEHQALRRNKDLLENYVHPQGLYEVRETLARFLLVSRGVNCRPEQLVLGSGTQLLTRQLARILPKETVYGLEEPGYQRVFQLLTSEGKTIKPLTLDEKGVSMKNLKKQNPDVVFTTPSHQFPTGIIMPISRRIQLLNWAASKEGRYIIEDDYDSEYKYDADSVPSLQSLDGAERVIYMGTFSKSLLPGLRISYMVLPISLLERYKQSLYFLMSSCSTITQLTLQAFIETGEYQKHIKRTTKLYRSRRGLLIRKLKAIFGEQIKVKGAKSGLHFVAAFNVAISEQVILGRAKELGLELYGMSRFYNHHKLPEKPALIIGFAQMESDEADQAVARLYQAVMGTESN